LLYFKPNLFKCGRKL